MEADRTSWEQPLLFDNLANLLVVICSDRARINCAPNRLRLSSQTHKSIFVYPSSNWEIMILSPQLVSSVSSGSSYLGPMYSVGRASSFRESPSLTAISVASAGCGLYRHSSFSDRASLMRRRRRAESLTRYDYTSRSSSSFYNGYHGMYSGSGGGSGGGNRNSSVVLSSADVGMSSRRGIVVAMSKILIASGEINSIFCIRFADNCSRNRWHRRRHGVQPPDSAGHVRGQQGRCFFCFQQQSGITLGKAK